MTNFLKGVGAMIIWLTFSKGPGLFINLLFRGDKTHVTNFFEGVGVIRLTFSNRPELFINLLFRGDKTHVTNE